MIESFRSGVYIHYKGRLYEATHLTHNATTDDRIEVHYVGLQLDDAHEGPRFATREFHEFFHDRVHPDGTICDGGCGPEVKKRFRYLGPVFRKWMLEEKP